MSRASRNYATRLLAVFIKKGNEEVSAFPHRISGMPIVEPNNHHYSPQCLPFRRDFFSASKTKKHLQPRHRLLDQHIDDGFDGFLIIGSVFFGFVEDLRLPVGAGAIF